MRLEAFIAPGEGASDALMDWLEYQEIVPVVRDVRADEEALAVAIALGAGRLPVVKVGDRTVTGFDPSALKLMLEPKAAGGGISVVPDGSGRLVVQKVDPGGIGEALGLRPGDVVTRLSGYTAFSAEQLDQALSNPPRTLVLAVRRGGEELELSLGRGAGAVSRPR